LEIFFTGDLLLEANGDFDFDFALFEFLLGDSDREEFFRGDLSLDLFLLGGDLDLELFFRGDLEFLFFRGDLDLELFLTGDLDELFFFPGDFELFFFSGDFDEFFLALLR